MTPSGLIRTLGRAIHASRDMIGVAILCTVTEPLVPADSLLARPDLGPWLAMTASIVGFIRARPLGLGAHPMLTPRRSTSGALFCRVAIALVPWVVLFWYDSSRLDSLEPFGLALGLSVGVAVLLALGSGEGETAWDPRGVGGTGLWLIGGLGAIALAAGQGRLAAWLPAAGDAWMAGLLAVQMLTMGLAAGRARHLRQRLAAGRRDGGRVLPLTFAMLLAAFGPGVGFLALLLAYRLVAGHALTFGEAWVASLFVCAWGAILWRPRPPTAVGCLLHEVVPVGGADALPDGAAVGFERPPEGALRLNPLRVRRLHAVHPWIVPVRSARIGDLDDPVSPLWAPASPLPSSHVLGEAAFEADPDTGAPQWDLITLRLGVQGDTMTVTEQDAQTRRVVVLRAFPREGSGRPRRATYLWEERVPEESRRVLDATTETCTLMDGDIIVTSSEGVARAFELEIGAPFEAGVELLSRRAPQVEDYAKVGE
jgi:hypothetical protein